MILSIENNHQTIKVLSSNPSQDQFGVWIPPPQVLANSQKWVHYTEYHSKFSCVPDVRPLLECSIILNWGHRQSKNIYQYSKLSKIEIN